MQRQLRLYLLAFGLVLGLTAWTSAGESEKNEDQEPTFTTIDFPGATATQGRDVTSDGDAYVREYDDTTGHHGFLLKSGTFTSSDVPEAMKKTDAHGINSHGDVVGVYRTANGQSHAYLLNGERSFTSFKRTQERSEPSLVRGYEGPRSVRAERGSGQELGVTVKIS